MSAVLNLTGVGRYMAPPILPDTTSGISEQIQQLQQRVQALEQQMMGLQAVREPEAPPPAPLVVAAAPIEQANPAEELIPDAAVNEYELANPVVVPNGNPVAQQAARRTRRRKPKIQPDFFLDSIL